MLGQVDMESQQRPLSPLPLVTFQGWYEKLEMILPLGYVNI